MRIEPDSPLPWRSTKHHDRLVKVENRKQVVFDGFRARENDARYASTSANFHKPLESLCRRFMIATQHDRADQINELADEAETLLRKLDLDHESP